MSRLFAYLFILNVCVQAFSTVFYVSKGGDDLNSGASWNDSFLTISKALVEAGIDDSVWVGYGNYQEAQSLFIPESISLFGGFAGDELDPNTRDLFHFKSFIDAGNEFRAVNNEGLIDGFYVYNGYSDSGAGISNDGGAVRNCHVFQCEASDYAGGIYNLKGSVGDCEIYDNVVNGSGYYGGGGITNIEGHVHDCKIYDNILTDGGCGGGIYSSGTVRNCEISENIAGFDPGNSVYSYGGGLYQLSGEVSRCNVFLNSAYRGGGIFAVENALVQNSIIRYNYADYGGGVYLDNATLRHATVVLNNGNFNGGGVYCENGPVQNCIVWNNESVDIYTQDLSESNTIYSCFGNSFGTSGIGNISENPLLIDMLGESVLDFHLRPNSPCIDAGGDQYSADFDYDGISRPQFGHVDIGAFEWKNALRPDFYANEQNVLVGENVLFTGYSSDEPDQWEWDFNGDGITDASGQTVNYYFSASGKYSVTLKVTKSGQSESCSKTDYLYVGTRYYVDGNGSNNANGLNWHTAFQSIEYALNYALPGDEIWVTKGTYSYDSTLTVSGQVYLIGGFEGDELYKGERDLESNKSIIDGLEDHICVENDGILDGFSIMRGRTGVVNNGTLVRCSVFDNIGTGIENDGEVSHCVIFSNRSGGIRNTNLLYQSLIYNNEYFGVYNYNGSVYNCTVYKNRGSGIACLGNILNCISWQNDGTDIYTLPPHLFYPTGQVAYCCYETGYNISGVHNISEDPLFIYPSENTGTPDLHLKPSSPCIDSGRLMGGAVSDLDGNARPIGDGFDMGCYEYSYELRADFSADQTSGRSGMLVHFYDMSTGDPESWEWDLDGDGVVDSTLQNPTFTYTQPGVYSVSLRIEVEGQTLSFTRSNCIYIGHRYYVKKDGSDENDGSSWDNAFASLSNSITVTSAYDDIWVATGMYQEGDVITVPEKVTVFGGFCGSETEFEQRNISNCPTSFSGENQYTCFNNYGVLDGLVITKGSWRGILNEGIVRKCVVKDCRLARMSSVFGGGIYNLGIVENSLLYNNAADVGGGIFNEDRGIVRNCTLFDNDANYVEGLFNRGYVQNCILLNNGDVDISGGTVVYSNFGTGTPDIEEGNIHEDPQFIDVSVNHLVNDFHLFETSPCINAGLNDNAPADDIEGNQRPVNMTIDMGAYEMRSELDALFYASSQIAAPDELIHFYSITTDEAYSYSWDFDGDGVTDSQEMNPQYQYALPGFYSVSLTVRDQMHSEARVKKNYIHITDVFYVKPDGNDELNGTSWDAAFKTIKKALESAYSGDQVHVSIGTYNEYIDIPAGVKIYGGLLERDNSESQYSVIDGESIRCCAFNNGYINGFHLINGIDNLDHSGGGLKNNGIAERCMISNCSDTGVFNMYDSIIRDSKIYQNESDNYGGGILNYSQVINCDIFKNMAIGGGGVYNNYGSISHCQIYLNTARIGDHDTCGGGVFNLVGTVSHCKIYSNQIGFSGDIIPVNVAKGGGVYTYDGVIEACKIYDNTNNMLLNSGSEWSSYGAGVFSNKSNLVNCEIFGNICSIPDAMNTAEKKDSGTLDSYGCGVFLDDGAMINCSVVNNQNRSNIDPIPVSNKGTGIYVSYGNVQNSIIYHNQELDIYDYSGGRVAYSCFETFSSGAEGTNCIHEAPQFMNASGVASSMDLRLKTNSPCIDSGSSDGAPAVDINGLTRPLKNGFDLGAHESPEYSENQAPVVYVLNEAFDFTIPYESESFELWFKASDIDGTISNVAYRLNDGAFLSVDPDAGTILLDVDQLYIGENVIQIYTVDDQDLNSAIVTLSIFWEESRTNVQQRQWSIFE